jgi:mannitol/fructose-specific phosphotransferase system IIA component (Ntr-type)
MRLRDYFEPDLINLRLKSTSRNKILRELVSMLGMERRPERRLYKRLRRRQQLGSTGLGNGIALVYDRTDAGTPVRLGFGRQPEGVDFKAFDGKPVYHFFLLFGPVTTEAPDKFLQAMGELARLMRDPDFASLLANLESREEFIELIDSKDE